MGYDIPEAQPLAQLDSKAELEKRYQGVSMQLKSLKYGIYFRNLAHYDAGHHLKSIMADGCSFARRENTNDATSAIDKESLHGQHVELSIPLVNRNCSTFRDGLLTVFL